MTDPEEITRIKQDPDWVILEDQSSESTKKEAGEQAIAKDTSQWFIQRQVGLGCVRAYRGVWDPVGFSMSWRMLHARERDADTDALPSTPLAAAIEATPNWPVRHGLSPNVPNDEFGNLLVPGMGLAPVSEFRVLIIVFVLVIGPLNYWLLKRWDRLHLLLLTVPIVAFGLTAALFGYALLSDGLSTTVRVRSFTTLDQATGEAACWARLSYYSGLAPGRGLAMPDDVTLYPIVSGWDDANYGYSSNDVREMQWEGGKQRLTQGWLESRIPTQYLSIRARKSPARLQLQKHRDAFVATNGLGTRVSYLAVFDGASGVYTGEAIDDRATVSLKPGTEAVALRNLRQLAAKNQPEFPPALAGVAGVLVRTSTLVRQRV